MCHSEQVRGPSGVKCVARVESQDYHHKMVDIMAGNRVPRKASMHKGKAARLHSGGAGVERTSIIKHGD